MGIYLLKNSSARSVKVTKQLIVQAETAADAKTFAASHFNGDGSWDDADATTITASTLDANASMLGWTWKIHVNGGAGQTADPISVSYVGAGVEDLDAVAAKLVVALNATEIANASYTAPNLVIATGAGGDDLGDATVVIEIHPPSGNTNANLVGLLTGTITHEGLATDALAVALVADTEATPVVLAEA